MAEDWKDIPHRDMRFSFKENGAQVTAYLRVPEDIAAYADQLGLKPGTQSYYKQVAQDSAHHRVGGPAYCEVYPDGSRLEIDYHNDVQTNVRQIPPASKGPALPPPN